MCVLFWGFFSERKIMKTLNTWVKTTRILDHFIQIFENKERNNSNDGDDVAIDVNVAAWYEETSLYVDVCFQTNWTVEERQRRLQFLLSHLEVPKNSDFECLDCTKMKIDMDSLRILINLTHNLTSMGCIIQITSRVPVIADLFLKREFYGAMWDTSEQRQWTVWLFVYCLRYGLDGGGFETREMVDVLCELLVRDIAPEIGNVEMDWEKAIDMFQEHCSFVMSCFLHNLDVDNFWEMCELGFTMRMDQFLESLVWWEEKDTPKVCMLVEMAMWYFPDMAGMAGFDQSDRDPAFSLYYYLRQQPLPQNVVIEKFLSWQNFAKMVDEASKMEMTLFAMTLYGDDSDTFNTNYPYFVLINTVYRQTKVLVRNALLQIPELPLFLEDRESLASLRDASIRAEVGYPERLVRQRATLHFLPRYRCIEIMHEEVQYRKEYLEQLRIEQERQDQRIAERRRIRNEIPSL
jgi:hypothetical protein